MRLENLTSDRMFQLAIINSVEPHPTAEFLIVPRRQIYLSRTASLVRQPFLYSLDSVFLYLSKREHFAVPF